MTREEKQKAINALKISTPIMAMRQERLNDYIQTLNKTIDWLEQEPNTWNLDDAREDFIYDVYNTLGFLPTYNEANQIIDSFDRVTSNIKKEPTLDKIRAEIEQLPTSKCTETYRIYINAGSFKEKVLEIFDKYIAESEE